MKNLFSFLILFASVNLFAQESNEITLGDFSTLKVFDLIEVKMITSDENKAVVSGEHAEEVQFVNKNGKLKIRLDIERSYQGRNTFVTLYYKANDLKVIDANEGAYIYFEEKLKQSKLDLRAQEGGKINVEIDNDYTEIKAVTGGIIEVNGTTEMLIAKLNTGGIYEGKDFISKNAKVNVNAAGEASVHTTNDLDIKIRAGGDVYVYGDPENLDKSRVFGGRIKKM